MNENCLRGMRCPNSECGSEGPFNIEVVTMVTMSDDGSEDCKVSDGMDWGPDSACGCTECGFSGVCKDFDEEQYDLVITISGRTKSGKTSMALLIRDDHRGGFVEVQDRDVAQSSRLIGITRDLLEKRLANKKVLVKTVQTNKKGPA